MISKLPINNSHQDLLADFETYLKARGYGDAKKYRQGARELMHRLEESGKLITNIGKEDIQNHYEYLLNRPSYRDAGALSLHTIKGYLFDLQLFFGYLEKTGLASSNPMSGLKLELVVKSERTVLRKAEIRGLYKSTRDEQERAILALFYGCGLRRSEAEKLDIRDVDFKNGWLYVRSGKGKKRRVIPLAQSVSKALKNYLYNQRPKQESKDTEPGDRKAFMLNKNGTRMKGGSYWKYFKRLLLRSSLQKQVSLHHLRHSIATHLLEGGMGIEEVRDFLGHDNLETTQIYTRVKTRQLDI